MLFWPPCSRVYFCTLLFSDGTGALFDPALMAFSDCPLPSLDLEQPFDLSSDLSWLDVPSTPGGMAADCVTSEGLLSPDLVASPAPSMPAAVAEACDLEPPAKRACRPSTPSSTGRQSAVPSPVYSPAASTSSAASACEDNGGRRKLQQRQLNNVAAKKSRDTRRHRDQENERLIIHLRDENELLRAEEKRLKDLLERAKLKLQTALSRWSYL